MFTAIFGSFEAGIIYAIMALGVYLSFRILDFPDLTVDGSFVTGAALSAVLIAGGMNPFLMGGGGGQEMSGSQQQQPGGNWAQNGQGYGKIFFILQV